LNLVILTVFKWDKFLNSLDDWFIKSHTLPDILVGLLRIRQWHSGLACAPYQCRSITAQDVFDAQNRIGWTPFFLGLIHPSWAVLQQSYYVELGKRNTGSRWVTQLLRKFWKVSWDLWTHRCSVLLSADSCATYQEHLSADSAVATAWEAYTANPLRLYTVGSLDLLQPSKMNRSISRNRGWTLCILLLNVIGRLNSHSPSKSCSEIPMTPPWLVDHLSLSIFCFMLYMSGSENYRPASVLSWCYPGVPSAI
jgi:hypothetical protein